MEFCRYGVPSGETTVTCTAGVGTTIIEFGTLSRLTGNTVFEEAAMRALRGLWHHRSSIGLVGNHIDVSRYNCKKILYLKFRELATWMIFFEHFVKLSHDVAISRINVLIHIFIVENGPPLMLELELELIPIMNIWSKVQHFCKDRN